MNAGETVGLAFFDTNILVYCDDAGAPEKQARAIELYREHRKADKAVVSVQVLQEYFAAVTRKLGLRPEIAQQKVELLAGARVVAPNAQDVIAAIELHRLLRLSFWDALIVHAARIGGAAILYTEDMQHGSRVGGIRLTNPFLDLEAGSRSGRT